LLRSRRSAARTSGWSSAISTRIGAVRLTSVLVTGHPSVAQLDDARTVARVRLRVRHLDDRRAGVVQRLEELHDFLALRRMQVARRFIGEEHFGARNHRARDANE